MRANQSSIEYDNSDTIFLEQMDRQTIGRPTNIWAAHTVRNTDLAMTNSPDGTSFR